MARLGCALLLTGAIVSPEFGGKVRMTVSSSCGAAIAVSCDAAFPK